MNGDKTFKWEVKAVPIFDAYTQAQVKAVNLMCENEWEPYFHEKFPDCVVVWCKRRVEVKDE